MARCANRRLLTVADNLPGYRRAAKAQEYGVKAVAASASPQQRNAVENLIKKYDDANKEK
jgi:hypothetical protein